MNSDRRKKKKLERRKLRRDSRYPRGSIMNHRITPKCKTSFVSKERLEKLCSPLDDLMKKGIQTNHPTRIDNPSVLKIWDERFHSSDGLNCFGNPFVDLGDVDYRVSDSVENYTPRFISFDQMVEMNSSKMLTPNGSLKSWGQGLTDEYIQKVRKEEPSLIKEKIKIDIRLITNSTVFTLTEELGFTDDVLNDSELMKKYMCWCVRQMFSFNGHRILMDTSVETYKNVLLGKEMDNLQTGYGSMTNDNGSKYVGEIVDGIPQGFGTMTQPNRRKYIGEIVDGLPHGKGTETYSTGIIYEGFYEDGLYHGNGTLTFPNGDKVEGNYRKGNPEGDFTLSPIGCEPTITKYEGN